MHKISQGTKNYHLRWIQSHIGIAGNEAADWAAVEAANAGEVDNCSVPRNYNCHINLLVRDGKKSGCKC